MSSEAVPPGAPEPRATYRLQLNPEFGFDDAAQLADYFEALGVSHVYLSPILQATPGSTHGYDVVDPESLNVELGGDAAYERMTQALSERRIGQLLDIVPNHMAIGPQNPWWWDVLENGPSSFYAGYFDVEWSVPEERLRDKVLLPILGDHSGRVIEAGEIRLAREGASFLLRYFDHQFPAAPRSLSEILGRAAARAASTELAFLADAHAALPLPTARTPEDQDRRHRDKQVLKRMLAKLLLEEPELAAAIDTEIEALNADPDALDEFLGRQNYRLAFWRAAARDLGYRRFFDVSTLVGTSVESARVFSATHGLIRKLIERGSVQGLRVDHIDGLRAPLDYLTRLRSLAKNAWILVEKILEPGEALRADWPIDGTTGYDFLNELNGLFVNPASLPEVYAFYAEFTGESREFSELAREKKRQVLVQLLGSDLNRLSALFLSICEKNRRFRDYSRHEVHEVLRETLAAFPVYRTYVEPERGKVSDEDRAAIHTAIESAKAARPDLDAALFDFEEQILTLGVTGEAETELVARFQQTSSPVMAKGVEDTAFYSYLPFVALNEVGGAPGHLLDTAAFHATCAERQARYPRALLATSTHDTKRSEDVRARLSALSEIPGEWRAAVLRWSAQNERHRTGEWPSRNAEYLFYQTLVGAYPLDAERAKAYLLKAAREEKQHTSWTESNADYEAALSSFIERVLGDADFLADLERFTRPLITPGRINSLSQTLIKLTAPGVPDLYQGSELWDLSLVDPDNRRAVDYRLRQRLLAECPELTPEAALARSDEGLPKLWLIQRVLRARRESPEPFDQAHEPLTVRGKFSGHVVAFQRGNGLIAVAQRLPVTRGDDWSNTVLELPTGDWRSVLSGAAVDGGSRPVAEILGQFPVELLRRAD
ncbi:MAG: malto-oligosyltrehalose synthase [Myxococcota bacterium]|nr:malto-oligosyltrehalose synthase [Myxococcota bacterium]